jgi:putative ABC transport system permease protein
MKVFRFLSRIGWRYLFRHPWQSCLMVLGITLGVAVAVAVDLANTSASRAFELSTEAVAGRATNFLAGSPQGMDEQVYTRLQRSGLDLPLAPVLSEYIASPQLGGELFQLLGLDPFAEMPFRDYLISDQGNMPVSTLAAFLTRPGAVFLAQETADRFDLQLGAQMEIEVNGQTKTAWIAGLIQPTDDLNRRALGSLVLADIATAQELTGRLGKLDRIDLILDPKQASVQTAALEKLLPQGVQLLPVSARYGALEQMAAAFRLNLTALSLLALVVGLFLIYNTMTFSVVRRRALFGRLRCLGVTRAEVFWLVMGEAALAGMLGAGLGIGLGILLGQGAVRAVTQTINDLFFVLNVRGVQIPISSLVKGAVLGVAATLLSAAPPAWEAASIPPLAALSRSGLETKARLAVGFAAVLGLLISGVGGFMMLLPSRSLVLGFGGTAAVVIGFAMLAPAATALYARAVHPLAGKLFGALGRMATRNVVKSLSRTSVAIASLMVAISVTIGVSLMVSSFRYTVTVWLAEILSGDIYISAPSLTAAQSSAPIEPRVLTILEAEQGVEKVYVLRSVDVDSPVGPIHINASSNPSVARERLYLTSEVPKDDLPEAIRRGGVVVSEPLAERLDLPKHGAVLSLYTDQGLKDFPVAGIYYDYASAQGTVLMPLDLYQQNWNDRSITAISLNLAPGQDVDRINRRIKEALAEVQRLIVRPNQALRAEVMAVFDRTFAITGALQLLATTVAFIGILSALLSLEMERQRDLGILRAIGLTAPQLWGLIMLETGLMGAAAGFLAMPTGYVLSLILIYIINKRSFGWTLQMELVSSPFIQAFALAVLAALLAGIYPAWRMSRMKAAEAMRYE